MFIPDRLRLKFFRNEKCQPLRLEYVNHEDLVEDERHCSS